MSDAHDFRTGVAIVGVFVVLIPIGVGAHSIVVDGDATDWIMPRPPTVNLGHVARSSLSEGEYVWIDAQGDERTDFSFLDSQVDLVELRMTADPDNLYLLATFSDLLPAAISGDGATQISVALDLDGDPSVGMDTLPALCDTRVAARWERVLSTRFGSGNSGLTIWDIGFAYVIAGTAVADATHNTIELSVPWAELGLMGHPDRFRFTVAVFRSDTSDMAWDVGGPGISDTLDAISNYGLPGTTPNTWQEVSDQMIDYSVDVSLNEAAEPIAPVLIHEILYNPSSTEPGGEFIEIVNRSPAPFDLGGCKVGDEETIGGGEGMQEFPAFLLQPGGKVVIAMNGDVFFSSYGYPPDFAIQPGDQPAQVTTPYTAWATGQVALSNSGDEVLFLDSSDTAHDVAVYGSGSWPSVSDGIAGVPENSSLQRVQPLQDTDQMDSDFEEISGGGSPIRNVIFVDGFESGNTNAWQ